jgi:MYXO-CTERM domain-containing protein
MLDAVDRGSCGCRTPGNRASGASALIAFIALAFGAARRRSRRRTRLAFHG